MSENKNTPKKDDKNAPNRETPTFGKKTTEEQRKEDDNKKKENQGHVKQQ